MEDLNKDTLNDTNEQLDESINAQSQINDLETAKNLNNNTTEGSNEEIEFVVENVENIITKSIVIDEQPELTDENFFTNAQSNNKTQTMLNQLNSLQQTFNEKLKIDKHKDAIIDKLHVENQQYKNDLIKNVRKDILKDLMFLIDDINKIIKKYESEPEVEKSQAKLLRYFKEVPEEIEELLYKYDVVSKQLNIGDSFDPQFHRALKTETTVDETKDRTIAAVLKKGYMWLDEKFRQAEVVVYKYEPAEEMDEMADSAVTKTNNPNETLSEQ